MLSQRIPSAAATRACVTARLNAFLNEQVNGIAVVQAFVRERSMASEFDGVNIGYRDANKSAIYYEAVLDASIEMVSTLCVASILWFSGLRRLGDHHITFALLVRVATPCAPRASRGARERFAVSLRPVRVHQAEAADYVGATAIRG